MYVEIGIGQDVRIGLRDTDGIFVIDYAKSRAGVLSIMADMPDTNGREGVIYEERFGDGLPRPDAQLLNAIAATVKS
jgi:hypothetical protein